MLIKPQKTLVYYSFWLCCQIIFVSAYENVLFNAAFLLAWGIGVVRTSELVACSKIWETFELGGIRNLDKI